MTMVEVKAEIEKALNNVPEDALPHILNYIIKVQTSPAQAKHQENFNKILAEDDKLFEKLAK